jgi:hypothetical protein
LSLIRRVNAAKEGDSPLCDTSWTRFCTSSTSLLALFSDDCFGSESKYSSSTYCNRIKNWVQIKVQKKVQKKSTKKIKKTTTQNKTKQNKTKQNKTKQNKTKQNKTKQNKTKQKKTKQTWSTRVSSPGTV